MPYQPYELPGLAVQLDKLVYQTSPNLPADSPHAFIYFLTIRNDSDREVVILARKWLIEREDGEKLVIEGDGVVGEQPRLRPGEIFSYNSFHATDQNAVASGSFHGVDVSDNPVFVRIPAIKMSIPDNNEID